MKTSLLIICLTLSISCWSQVDTTKVYPKDQMYTHLNKAANSLDRFHRQAIFSLGTEFLGATLIAGAYIKPEDPNKLLLVSGIAVGTIGFFMFVNSFLEVHDAAIELRKIKPSSSGVGIAYSF